ncbi:MAG: NADH-quinone oxidoreductase subunit NuoK [Candidatus Caenarcaniphilales bacterium]|nr:NADH-quinone oxidoreductase subunit NuoK [Candidatus Caenarcaniphilales bacterium]
MEENKFELNVFFKRVLAISLGTSIFVLFWITVVLQATVLAKYLTLGAALFCIGIYGIFKSNSVLKTLICMEILFNAAILNLITFARFTDVIFVRGQMFSLFVMAIAAAEAALGLALVIAYYRMSKNISVAKLNHLQG